MEKTVDFLVRHPVLVAGFFAVVTGMAAYNTFQAGMTYARLRASAGEAARVASEALGG